MANLVQTIDKLTAKLDKLQSVAAGKGMGLGESLKNINWTTQFQAQMHNVIGATATRNLKAGTGLAGSALQLGGTLIGGQGLGGIADRAIKGSATEGLKGIGGFASDVGGKLMQTGNPYAVAAGAVIKFAGAVAEVPAKVKEWADNLHEANRQFADFSGSMAAVIAIDDARRIMLQKEQGDRRAASAKELAEARYRMDAAMAPLEDAFANLKNSVVSKLAGALADVTKGLTELLQLLRLLPKDQAQPESIWPKDIDQKMQEIRDRRPRHMR